MSKTTKFYSKIALAVKITTAFVFAWILIKQRFVIQEINFDSITEFKVTLFLFVLLLTPLNWYFEYLKWKYTLKTLDFYSKKESAESFLSGIFSGFITPNFIGNFIGRMLYYPFKLRPKIVLFTLLASYSQFFTTITIGVIALLFLPSDTSSFTPIYTWLFLTLVIIGWLVYFIFEKLNLQKIKALSFFRHFDNHPANARLKWQFILFNVVRYAIFSLQYLLMLNVFQIEFNSTLYNSILLIYLWSTLIPNFIWGKLFLRESVALVILLPIIDNASIILIATFSLSIINQIIPAIIGIPYLMKKKKYE